MALDWSYLGLIATACSDGVIRIFDKNRNFRISRSQLNPLLKQWKFLISTKATHSGDVNVIRWSPKDQRLLVSGGDDGIIRIWKYEK